MEPVLQAAAAWARPVSLSPFLCCLLNARLEELGGLPQPAGLAPFEDKGNWQLWRPGLACRAQKPLGPKAAFNSHPLTPGPEGISP